MEIDFKKLGKSLLRKLLYVFYNFFGWMISLMIILGLVVGGFVIYKDVYLTISGESLDEEQIISQRPKIQKELLDKTYEAYQERIKGIEISGIKDPFLPY